MPKMTTAEATVATLIAHGIDTMYCLPGIHNDHLFDALFNAQDKVRTIWARHEQGAAYMALGAELATGKPQAYTVVPGPGMLNTSAALLNAYSMNAQVLAVIGQIPARDIGRGFGHLHELRDQSGILQRLADHHAHIKAPHEAAGMVAQAFAAMRSGRPGPASLECAIDVWGKPGETRTIPQPIDTAAPVDDDAILAAAKALGAAKRPMIICGGGAQDASAEVTALSEMLQAPVLGYRRGRGVLDSRNPLSITVPLAHELWAETDVVLAVGTRMHMQLSMWGADRSMTIIRVDADPDEPDRYQRANLALVGQTVPQLRALVDALPAHNTKRASRHEDMTQRQAKWRTTLTSKLAPQAAFIEAIRAELPEEGIFVDEVTQIGFVSRLLLPIYKPRTFISPGFQDNLGWGFATALGVQDARRDVPVVSISGDGGFLYTANEMATAMRHRIPLVSVVFADGAFGNVRRIQEEQYGNRLIASDLHNPDFVKFAESFGAAAERVRTPGELRGALKRGFARRDGPTLIEVPVGPMPSPWEFIMRGRVKK